MQTIPKGGATDPNLFALDWNTVFEVLITIVILAFILERALALLFESPWFLKLEARRKERDRSTFKPLIAFVLAAIGCTLWEFDALSIILVKEHVTVLGAVITGAVVAGGSKASLKLFRDVLDIKSNEYRRAVDGQPPPRSARRNNKRPPR